MEIGLGQNILYDFFREVLFLRAADSMQKRGYRRAHGHLRDIKLERIDSGRVALPSIFVWSPKSEI